jgi:hypothetical protein
MPPDFNLQATEGSPGTFYHTKGEDAGDQVDQDALPAHLAALKNVFLNFSHFVGLEASILVLCDEELGGDEGDAIPLSAYKTDGAKASQRMRERELLEDARMLAEGARKLERGSSQNTEWQNLFQSVVKKG